MRAAIASRRTPAHKWQPRVSLFIDLFDWFAQRTACMFSCATCLQNREPRAGRPVAKGEGAKAKSPRGAKKGGKRKSVLHNIPQAQPSHSVLNRG